ncbi:riboflavin kinase / FMN adenylyltransferase [Clostridium sp. USBA 49]|jgi:riboflavin kinase/FMN adenylyltransferase|uniref:bifunctional riboflavin kinase/FAD synthetase n=1 Tax=Clostridium TaxID=1485 RepID=UPI00099A5BD4|nr:MULTISPECIES: bifunctional riboflavin kinase/FAD synthetase [Clostridium]SKA76512.1 riboflavin kinase / FMN adenylyltransferase [Clostridium sp. USBA 49]
MIILEDNFKTYIKEKTYIALGSFDGLHIGHISLINKAIELSKLNNSKSMVYTFKNHPLSIINKNKTPKLLMDNYTKLNILKSLGIEIVNLVHFNNEFMKISPEDFIYNMIKFYNVKGIIAGFNYRFGYKNNGDVELLKKLSKKFKFELYIVNPIVYNKDIVSSSRIRNLIGNGEIETANKMLLIPFMLGGKVIKGKQIGRTIGFPTANLKYNINIILPRKGVYFTLIQYQGNIYKGITSIGYNPTVENSKKNISVETYILDFNKDIYGENINIYFISRIRDEIKFNSIKELATQLEKDKNFAQIQKIEDIEFKIKNNLQSNFYLL